MKSFNLKNKFDYFLRSNIYDKVIVLCNYIYIIWLFIPQVQGFFGIRLALACFSVSYVCIFIQLIKDKKALISYIFRTLLVFLISIFYWLIYVSPNIKIYIYIPQLLLFFWPFLLAYYVVIKNKVYLLKGCLLLVLISCLLTSITSIQWLSVYPSTARALGFGEMEKDYAQRAMSFGIGGFGFFYGLPVLIAFLLNSILIRKSYIFTFLVISICVVFTVAAFYSRYFLSISIIFFAIFLFIINIFWSFIFRNKNINKFKYTLITLGVIAILLIVFHEFFLNNIIVLFNNYGFEEYAERLSVIKEFIKTFDFTIIESSRLGEYVQGLKAIIRRPLTGGTFSEFYDVSYHSVFIDMFAGLGIPAGIGIFTSYLYLNSKIHNVIKNKKVKDVLIYTYFIFIIIALSNTLIYSREASYILLVLPLLLNYYFERENIGKYSFL